MDSKGPSGLSLIAALLVAGSAAWLARPSTPHRDHVVVASPSPIASASAAPRVEPTARATPQPIEVRLSCPELVRELQELRRTLQSCLNPGTDDRGKSTGCGRCFYCTMRRIAVSR